MPFEVDSLGFEFRESWITNGFVSEETAGLVVTLAPEQRAVLVECVLELCQPLEGLTDGETNRLSILKNMLGRESLTDTVVETILSTKPTERHKKAGHHASIAVLRKSRNKKS